MRQQLRERHRDVARARRATSREGRPEQEWAKEVQALVTENAAKTPDLKAYAGRKTLDLYWQRSGGGGVKGTMQVAMRSWGCGWSAPSATAIRTTSGSRTTCSASPTSSCA